jgi:hypothetical protein
VVVAVAIIVIGAGRVFGDDGQSSVSVERGGGLPDAASLNRADDAGADTLRAFLAGALACDDEGTGLMLSVSRRGTNALETFSAGCRGARSAWTRLDGELDPDELDQAGRARWRITGEGGPLPEDLYVRLRMRGEGWEIDRSCEGACPRG